MKKRLCSMLLALTMALGFILPAAAADEAKFPDTVGHWGESAIERWAGYGVIKGTEEGVFKPEANMSRGDLAVMLSRMMGYSAVKDEGLFTDLSADAYYAPAVLALNHAGVLKGDGVTVRPAANITRQEIAVLLARVLGLPGSETATSFSDVAQIASWAVPAVNAMTAKGYFLSDTATFRPEDNITRAEVTTLLDRAFPTFVNAEGAVDKDATGNVLVTAAGVSLKNMKVTGDLIIAEGVGDGDVTLDGVTVTGNVLVRGGGANSIHIKGNSTIANVIVARQDSKVRIAVEGNAAVTTLEVADGSSDVKIDGKLTNANVTGSDVKVEITGTVQNVQVEETAAAAAVTVGSGAKVDSLTTAAPGSVISVSGTVKKMETATTATGTAITAAKGGSITTVVAAGEGTQISGEGKVANVEAKGNNVAVKTSNTKVSADSGVTGTTAGDKPVDGGSSANTPAAPGGGTGGAVTPTTYTIGFGLNKVGIDGPVNINMGGLSSDTKVYTALTTLYNEEKTAIINGFNRVVEKLIGTNLVDIDGILTASGVVLLDKAKANYATLTNELKIVVKDEAVLAKLLVAFDPTTLVDNDNKLLAAGGYYSNVKARVESFYEGIKGMSSATDETMDALASAIQTGLNSRGITLKVGSTPIKQDQVLSILNAIRADATISQWMATCPTELTAEYVLGKTISNQDISVPEKLQGTYTVTFTLK